MVGGHGNSSTASHSITTFDLRTDLPGARHGWRDEQFVLQSWQLEAWDGNETWMVLHTREVWLLDDVAGYALP